MFPRGTPTATASWQNAASAGTPDRPRLGSVIKRVVLSLLIACVIPGAVFYATLRATDVWTAIFAALAWSYGAIAWRWLTRRRASGLLILTAAVMTGRTVISFVTDSTFLYFLQPVISQVVVATAFLLSLATARPMVARLAGDFYPMSRELHLRPRIQRLFWHLTVVWAALCLVKGTMTLWLLQSQSTQNFVLFKGISSLTLDALAAGATIGAAAVVARKEGLLGPVPTERLVPVPV